MRFHCKIHHPENNFVLLEFKYFPKIEINKVYKNSKDNKEE